MSLVIARPLNAIMLLFFMCATALSAVAQGQTPTSPQQTPSTPEVRRRPSPSSGIPWPPPDEQTPVRRPGQAEDSPAARQTTPAAARRTETAAPPTAREGTAAERAADDSGPGREPPAARTPASAPRAVGGVGAGATAATPFTRGTVAGVSMSGQGAFEPVLEREPDYGDLPDTGEPLTLEGPMSIQEFLAAINLATNWNVMVSPIMQDVQLRFWIYDVTPRQALEVLKFNKVFYEFDEETQFLRVMTREEYLEREYGKTKPHEFRVNHADVTYIESLINSLLSPSGRVITDQRTNNIYVWDTDDNLQEMVRIVAEIDVPLQKSEFAIEHAEVADIEAVLASFMSPSGSILSDVRTGQIFVWDAPSVLDQMRTAVQRLDQPVESQTFYITHISAEDVLDSVELMLTERGTIQVDPRYNTLVVTDLPPRIAKIASVIETLDKPLDTRTWVLKYADLDFVADQIEAYIPGEMGQIVIQDEVHQITVTGLPSRLDEIDALITTWDVRRRQVLIEAHVVEVSTDIERAFNVNWSYFSNLAGSPFAVHSGDGAESIAGPTGSGQVASGGRLPYAVPRYGALQIADGGGISRPLLRDITGEPIIDRYVGGNLSLALDYLDRQQKATILSSPRVTVQDGEEAVFENATRVPYVSSTGGGYGYGFGGVTDGDTFRRSTAATSRVEFIDVGTILSVLPRITDDFNVLLDISAEDSTFTDKRIVVDDLTRTVPEKTVRRADTQVRVNTGETIVLGGLRRDRAGHSTNRTPVLGDLPLVGRLFRNPRRVTENNTLLIFITPTIVDESTMPESKQIADADQKIAEMNRQMGRDLMGRVRSRLSDSKNEIGVSIGQGGTIHCAGSIVTADQLRERFFDAPRNMAVTAVIRKHPHAPIDIVNEVTEAAMEAGLRIEFDNEIPAIVPSLPPSY